MRYRYFAAFYRTNPMFREDLNLKMTDLLSDKFRLVRCLSVATFTDMYSAILDKVLFNCQGEVWSLNAKHLIKTLGLQHTSMNVGDVILDTETNRAYQVMVAGFMEVEK